MPFLAALFLLFSFSSFATINEDKDESWETYPKELQKFDYSGDKLKQNWEILSAGTGLDWPDVKFIKSMIDRFPNLSKQLLELAKQKDSHPALKPILEQDYLPLALAIQQVWRLHFQGEFQQAYNLGMELGPAGFLPALYSKLIHTTFLITDIQEKEEKFKEVGLLTAPLITQTKGFDFLLFGDSYQKARRLELMTTTEATASGLLGPTQDRLKKLHAEDPDNILYSAMLAGIDGGIIERVGGFIGGMTYGADEDKAIDLFDQSIEKENRLPVLYNEFALMLIRLDDSDYDEKLSSLLTACINLKIYSAEEALNQKNCHTLNQQRKNN